MSALGGCFAALQSSGKRDYQEDRSRVFCRKRDSAAALIQAVEAAEHPHQDNTTVLLYAPAEGTE